MDMAGRARVKGGKHRVSTGHPWLCPGLRRTSHQVTLEDGKQGWRHRAPTGGHCQQSSQPPVAQAWPHDWPHSSGQPSHRTAHHALPSALLVYSNLAGVVRAGRSISTWGIRSTALLLLPDHRYFQSLPSSALSPSVLSHFLE